MASPEVSRSPQPGLLTATHPAFHRGREQQPRVGSGQKDSLGGFPRSVLVCVLGTSLAAGATDWHRIAQLGQSPDGEEGISALGGPLCREPTVAGEGKAARTEVAPWQTLARSLQTYCLPDCPAPR